MRSLPLTALPLVALVACSRTEGKPGKETLPEPSGLGLVPLPAMITTDTGGYTLDATSGIGWTGGGEAEANLLAEALRASTGFPLPVTSDGDIQLVLDPDADLPAEGYTLDVTDVRIVVTAADTDGLYWGTQTLRQLLPPESLASEPVDGVTWTVPAVHVEDAPRFGWRGLMIDVARHFFDSAEIERQIDLMALHKMNRLHLHLTDDQGWRIEIKSWPDLTRIGGATEVGGGEGGYYTQEQFAELVDYAAARHITIVPEIDLPGHANAAVASYGELDPDGIPADPYTGTPVISTPIWLDGPDTDRFVTDVLGELAGMTPGPWLHVGGDEAVDIAEDDYTGFVARMQEIVDATGHTLVGWDEIGDAPLGPPFVAQHWFHADEAVAAVDRGGQLVASPAKHAYFDMVYDDDAEFGQVWAGAVNVQRAYDWDPVPAAVEEGDVLGVEGALWTEYIDSRERMDFMVWPRLAAHAEVGWTAGEARDWDDFRGRLAIDGARLDELGVGYYRTPEIDWEE